MFKLFTVDQANRLIPSVKAHVGDLQQDLHDLQEARERMARQTPGTLRAHHVGQEVAFLMSAVHRDQRELMRLGVEVRDVEQGVVAFPSRLGQEVVHLVWRQGEDAVTHYRRLTGDAEPHPLPAKGELKSEGSPLA